MNDKTKKDRLRKMKSREPIPSKKIIPPKKGRGAKALKHKSDFLEDAQNN